ncbi:MAG: ferritin family protein [Clostridia bacterium]|nr:ferritin family protein [Clostridia bacterium]
MDLLKFSGKELIDIAVTIEEKGEQLYRRLAVKVEDIQVTELFFALAEEEKQHGVDFTKLGAGLAAPAIRESYSGEYGDYLRTLVDTHLLIKAETVDELLGRVNDVKQALELAIAFEKDSLLIFVELANMVKDSDKEVLYQLIAAEQQHIARLKRIIPKH